jgi:hypothetical protein
MFEVRVPKFVRGAGELGATGLFVVSVAAVAALVAFVPHTARVTPLPYTAVNGTVAMNWFFHHPSVRPAPSASTYGLLAPPLPARAGATFSVTDTIRPSRAPGGRVCLVLLAITARSSTPAQTAQRCAPLAAGWGRFPTVTLRTAAPSRVYAEITARGNDGGFEARQLLATRVAS